MEAVLSDFVAGRLGGDADAALRSRIVAAVVMATLRATLDYWRDTDGVAELIDLMDSALAMLAQDPAALSD